jgi:hypothetical protein
MVLANIPKKFLVAKNYLNYLNSYGERSRVNYELELFKPYEKLEQGYTNNCRRNLEHAVLSPCILSEGLDAERFLSLYMDTTGKKDPLEKSEYQKLERLITMLVSKGAAELVAVYSPVNHLCAAGVFASDGRRIYYLAGASDPLGRKYFSAFLILDHIIKKYAGQNKIFDFEGSEIKGVARFFSGFGATESRYWVYTRNGMPWPLKKFIDKKLS